MCSVGIQTYDVKSSKARKSFINSKFTKDCVYSFSLTTAAVCCWSGVQSNLVVKSSAQNFTVAPHPQI